MKISHDDYYNIPDGQRNGKYEVEGHGTFYYVNGKCHRKNGPAIKYFDGTKEWCINDQFHRLDGPAREFSDGYSDYWIEGQPYSTKEEFEAAVYLYKKGLQDYL